MRMSPLNSRRRKSPEPLCKSIVPRKPSKVTSPEPVRVRTAVSSGAVIS